MAGPWEKYQQADGPWAKYAEPPKKNIIPKLLTTPSLRAKPTMTRPSGSALILPARSSMR